ncbi:ABC transporter permease [Verrucomicrobia bacterium]|nr:ABC transporter permease [Verrucomicrobiota bacterium]
MDEQNMMTRIEPQGSSPMLDFKELWRYRDLFVFWTWRSIKVRYAQSALGISWAVIQPLFTTLLFTIIFGNLAKLDSAGVPYVLFSFAALVPWTFFANSVSESTSSLIQNANMISKIYFPRLILPVAAVFAKFIDFMIAMVVMCLFLIYYQILPGWSVLLLPAHVLLMLVTSSGVGILLTALALQYRDVKYGISFLIQLLMYLSPVVYSVNIIPTEYRYFYAINPMVGVIESFRSSILHTAPMPWDLWMIGWVSSLTLLFFSLAFFRRKERLFADIA